jgi:purine-binding chemotaxis protein CheW
MMLSKTEILKSRAEKLAQVISVKEPMNETIEVLVFKLAGENYAIETMYIKEVYRYKNYTLLPGAPPFVFGLINVRRKVLSIIDLKVFFSLPATKNVEYKVIIVEDREMEFAILTDGIVDIQKISLNHIQPSLPHLTEAKQEFLKGITANGLIVLDGKKLLSSKRIIVDEKSEMEK